MIEIALGLSLFLWILILLLPWQPWRTKERFDSCEGCEREVLGELTVLIPARNEAASIKHSLTSLLSHSEELKIIVIDDCSDDGTDKVAKEILGDRGKVIGGTNPPHGWSGKLWALEQGLREVKTKYVLLLDADIVVERGIVSSALSFMMKNKIDLFSLMAWLHMKHPVERLFLPAFVYFFKLIYPFSLVNKKGHFVAAAAGGFILTKTTLLRQLGAFSSIRDCIIDDCNLARLVKRNGGTLFLGLTHCVKSIRQYKGLDEIWKMVERTAYTQLGYNPVLLLIVTILMVLAFVVPVLGIVYGSILTLVISFLTLFIMAISYRPVLKYYFLPDWLCFTLPLVAVFYMGMTWSSAAKYYLGQGAAWKGRTYRKTKMRS